MKTYIFHGPSGCGKDTQINLLYDYLDLEKISTGDMYRIMPGEGDKEAAYWAQKVWKEGLFPSGKVTYGLFEKFVKRFDFNKDWIFVSIVRLEDQIKWYEEFMTKIDRKLDKFVHFKLSEEVAIERMADRLYCEKCFATYHPIYNPEKKKGFCDNDGHVLIHRIDDQPDQIKERMKQYRENLESIKKHFEEKGLWMEIDAAPSIQEIHKDLVAKLNLKKEN